MRIVLAAVGARSDIFPMMALARGLQTKGHSITLCIPESYRSLTMQAGFRMVSAGVGFPEYLNARGGFSDANRALGEALAREAPVHFVALRDCMREVDVLVGSPLVLAGPSMAEQVSLPYFCVIFSPVYMDRKKFPCWGVERRKSGLFSSWRREVRSKYWNDLIVTAINREREVSHLDSFSNLYTYFFESGHLLVAADAELVTATDGFNQTTTGFWFFDPPGEMDTELDAFLKSGTPPVYIEFTRAPDEIVLVQHLCRRLRSAGHRVLIHSLVGLSSADLPAGCRVVDSEPYIRLLDRVGAVAHQGGAELTAFAARAGVPQVIAPYLLDQAYWAERIQAAGIGVRTLSELSQDKLMESIEQAIGDSVIREKARAMGEKIRARDGVGVAVGAIEKLSARIDKTA